MGKLVDGAWKDVWYDTSSSGGAFRREEAKFRDVVTRDGSSGFRAEAGRYHLYVSYACPWAHRTIVARALKGLEHAISMSVVNPFMGEQGWTFDPGPGVVPDHVNGKARLYEVYLLAKPDMSGRVTVPVLWDTQRRTIVSNESSEILRMLTAAFDDVAEHPELDLYPEPLRAEIDAINAGVYDRVNNGVYKAGFATTQEVYEQAVGELFAELDALEARLTTRTFLVGERFTEADLRLWTTLVRFDAVYVGHFKCNVRRLVDYPALWRFARRVYAMPGIAATVRFDHIKEHYYRSHPQINPTRIVPVGPDVDWMSHL